MIRETPLFFLNLELGPGTDLSQETRNGVNLVGEGYGRLLPVGLQGWPLKFVQHVAEATGVLHLLRVHFAASQPLIMQGIHRLE